MVTAIACVDKNMGIGYKGKLLAHIPEDMKRFKELTTNNTVIMGRKTWDSLGKKPLPNRFNIVVTRDSNLGKENTNPMVLFCDLNYVRDYIYHNRKTRNIYVIGGEEIYKELLNCCDTIMLTQIDKIFKKVDTYFPEIDKKIWNLYRIDNEGSNTNYCFKEYRNKNIVTNLDSNIVATHLSDRQKLILVDLVCKEQISMIQKNRNLINDKDYLELEQIKIVLKGKET